MKSWSMATCMMAAINIRKNKELNSGAAFTAPEFFYYPLFLFDNLCLANRCENQA